MSDRRADDGAFFIGYVARTGRRLGAFLAVVGAAAVAGVVMLGIALSAAVDDPGDGDYVDLPPDATFRGVVTMEPYPLLHLAADAAHPLGHAMLLGGEGKNGPALPSGSVGRLVEASGAVIRRGTTEMLLVADPPTGVPGAAAIAPPNTEQLGRWRLTGEICDGKCYAGVMRPGRGLAHRACANLCIYGGLPPIFVSTGPIAGSSFLLLADPEGHAVSDLVRDLVAVRVELEGDVERRDDLLVLRADLAHARRL